MVSRFIPVIVGVALLLAACGRTEPVASADNTTTTATTGVVSAPATTVPTTEAAEQPTAYVVQPGDSVGRIASAYGLNADELAAYNNLDDPNRIAAGQQLLIPPGATSTSTTPTTAAAPPPETTETTASG
ncbi:MAG: LysM peptidoglycan-binding domain-containing protein [Acidimicrobiales bacterium]